MAASVSSGSPAAPTDPRELHLRDLVSKGDADTLVSEVARLVESEATKAVAAASLFKTPDPPKPEQFHGDSRHPPSIQSWQYQVVIYLSHWPHLSEEEKVRYAAGYLKGSALLWWQHLAMVHGDPVPLKTLDEFLNALRAAFLPPNSVDRARHDLASLRQSGSVRQYLDTFNALCLRIQADQLLDAEKKQRFLDGLKPRVRREVLLRFPDTFEQAAKLADQQDQEQFQYSLPTDYFELMERMGKQTGSSENFRSVPNTPVAPDSIPAVSFDEAAPMELGTIQAFGSHSPLSADERQYLIQNHGCFYCRQANVGHRAYSCPLKRRFDWIPDH